MQPQPSEISHVVEGAAGGGEHYCNPANPDDGLAFTAIFGGQEEENFRLCRDRLAALRVKRGANT